MRLKIVLLPFLLGVGAAPLAAQNADVALFWKAPGNRPYAVACDGRGAMYVVTAPPTGNGLLSRLAPDGSAAPVAALVGSFIGPGIDIGADGTVYVTVGDKLVAVDPRGEVRTAAEGFGCAMDVKLDHRGNMFVADDLAGTVYKIGGGKKEVLYRGSKTGQFVLTALAFDGAHEILYIREGDAVLALKPADPKGKNAAPDVVGAGVDAFSLCLFGGRIYFTSPSGRVSYLANGAAVIVVSGGALLRTPIGIAAGGTGFDERSLYVAVAGGVVKVTPRE